jgi:N-hydroxyarylamine O-acetyltransferase
MAGELDLAAYLQRIGLPAAPPRGLAGVTALLQAHLRSIHFENLDVLLGRPITLDLPSLQDKLVRQRRGGYCFEQVTLFAAALDALGYAPLRHTARVVRYLPREQAPRTHMFLTVALEGARHVLDPGLGGPAPGAPVPLGGQAPVPAGAEHWMARDGSGWKLVLRAEEGAADLWVSDLEPAMPVDFEMANHYTATHPASIFRNRLMLRALTPQGRVTVMNRELRRQQGAAVLLEELADRRALGALLRADFGIDLPQVERLRVPAVPGWD